MGNIASSCGGQSGSNNTAEPNASAEERDGEEWDKQKEALRKAAVEGDVSYMRTCVESKAPREYYLTLFEITSPTRLRQCNILHLAVLDNKREFTYWAHQLLQPDIFHSLLIQPNCSGDNPLHLAARFGALEILQIYLNFYVSLDSIAGPVDHKPWLMLNARSRTPCHEAVAYRKQKCAIELLKMDRERLSNLDDADHCGLLYLAIKWAFVTLASEILKSEDFSVSGPDTQTAFNIMPVCSGGQKICRHLIERKPFLVERTTAEGWTILHSWARQGIEWPFKYVGEYKDIIRDIGKVLVRLMCTPEKVADRNPFHFLAMYAPIEMEAIRIIKILIQIYRQEQSSSSVTPPPWLASDRNGQTPLHLCLARTDLKFEKLAMHILSEETDVTMKHKSSNLLMAIRNGCQQVAETILNQVEKERLTDLTDHQNVNALHVAPYCTDDLVKRLIDDNPDLVLRYTSDGRSIFHTWMEIGKVWPFRHIFERTSTDIAWERKLIFVICKQDSQGNTVFHHAAHYNHETVKEIVQLLVDAFKRCSSNWLSWAGRLPWFRPNYVVNVGALQQAIKKGREELALQILSLHVGDCYDQLLDYYEPKHQTLFLAMENSCYRVVKCIIANLNNHNWTQYLQDPAENGKNILHFASTCTDRDLGILLVKEAPVNFITMQGTEQPSPLSSALNKGADWIVREMLKKHGSCQSPSQDQPQSDPFITSDWIGACTNGHVSTICAFIDCYPGSLMDLCRKLKDSPLHHINLKSKRDYERFLQIPEMKDLINFHDSAGATPLHKAIERKNISLTGELLKIDSTLYYVSDHDNEIARHSLAKLCKTGEEWKEMCIDSKYDPSIKTKYLRNKKSLLETRSALFVVAALLATITFTAGFTIPGGFNQDTGEVILGKKKVFLVFLISNAFALCCSMLILRCLLWSVVSNNDNEALLLTDNSMKLLKFSLYSTMLAFVTGVYAVTHHKCLWAAIFIAVMCFPFFILSCFRGLLHKFMDYI